jgi:hypothetical protein
MHHAQTEFYGTDSVSVRLKENSDNNAATLAGRLYQNPKEFQSISNPSSAIRDQSAYHPITNAQLLFPSSETTDSSKPAPKTEWKADNSVSHLLQVGTCSFVDGLYEPVAGGAQLAEESINRFTETGPFTHQRFFAPEMLSPNASQEPQAPKYSTEWYVSTIGKNLGMLPDYALAAVCISKIPGFKAGESFLSENRILGMNVKTAAASGFTIGALAPINDNSNTSFNNSLKERLIQGSIGAEQMGVMTASTALVGKGYTAAERALTTGGESAVASETLAAKKTILEKITSPTLTAIRSGSIATIGALPAGFSAAYLNAEAHGTEFDPSESVVSSAVTAFGLGAIGGGSETVARTGDVRPQLKAPIENAPVSPDKEDISRANRAPGEKPAEVDLLTGVMEPGNGYLEKLRQRLGGGDSDKTVMWNNSPSLGEELAKADTIVTDRADPRVQRATFKDDPQGLTKIVATPDDVSNIDGGIRYTASFTNNPEGILQVDDYADGTRSVRQADPRDGEESRTDFFPDGSVYTYLNQDAWSLTMPNGNEVCAYQDNIVAREIVENGRVTMVNRTGQIMYTGGER